MKERRMATTLLCRLDIYVSVLDKRFVVLGSAGLPPGGAHLLLEFQTWPPILKNEQSQIKVKI